ncbi:MAG: hypothetical protein KDK33_05020 [Leptospiraceae bacterium]|nr:hypothetical protein [Leptospiraceae bacterium]
MQRTYNHQSLFRSRGPASRFSGLLQYCASGRARISWLLLAVLFSQCAVFDRKNTILINAVEEHMVPETQPAKLFLALIYIPVGLVAGVGDAFVLHPLRMIPYAIDDTNDALWEFSDDTGYVTHAGSVVYRGLLSPVVFTGAWLFRSAFITDWDEETEEPESNAPFRQSLDNGDVDAIQRALSRCSKAKPSTPEILEALRKYEGEFLSEDSDHRFRSMAYEGSQCLLSRPADPAIVAYFRRILTTPRLLEVSELQGPTLQYYSDQNTTEAARALINAASNGQLSMETRTALIQRVLYMQKSARKVLFDALGSPEPSRSDGR